MSNRYHGVAERLRRALVPAAIALLLLLILARATRPTAAVQHVDEETAGQSAADIKTDRERGLFQSPMPTPTYTRTPAPTPISPTDTPTPISPTDTPTPIPPTNTPTPIPPTNTPTPIPPTNTPVPIPPEMGDLAVDPPDGIIPVDAAISFTAVFTDPNPGNVGVDWYWGDGSSTNQSGVSSPAQASHAYAAAGIYAVLVRVTNDASGLSDTASYEFVIVYDPTDGFVTGGGWIDSPAGAYTYDTSLTGKATFAFVSKYTKGKQTPTGTTQFKFNAAGFEFNSDHYYWLVVKGNDEALFSGSGTINGQLAPNGDPYKFSVWANDAEPDAFRIRIWWEEFDAAATEHVIYDNGAHQTIGGGSIVIHSGKGK
ncbi:MAG: PKD domain-containing protein [Chloroflexota bacterium]